MVLDADALNILGNHPEWIPEIPQDTILTPHPKELEISWEHVPIVTTVWQKPVSCPSNAIICHRERTQQHDLYTDGTRHHQPTGNAGMATAGSGDVLTGILTALLARGYTANEACQLGTYLHGLAGDIARERLGEESMIASDIIDALPEAFKKLKE